MLLLRFRYPIIDARGGGGSLSDPCVIITIIERLHSLMM